MTTKKNMMSMESKGFKVEVTIIDGRVQVMIDDRERSIDDTITGVSVISVYHNDDSIRVATDYNVRLV